MLRIFKYITISIVICLNLTSLIFADESNNPAGLLNAGLQKFQKKDYRSALSYFSQLAQFETENEYADAGLFLSAKTQIRLGQFVEAFRSVSNLSARFPQSKYIDDAVYLQAEIFYALGQDDKAYHKLFRCLENDVDPRLSDLARKKLSLLLRVKSPDELSALKETVADENKPFIDKIIRSIIEKSRIIVLVSESDSASFPILQGLQTALDGYLRNTGNIEPKLELKEVKGNLLDLYLGLKDINAKNTVGILSLLKGNESLIAAAAGASLDIPFFIIKDDTPNLWKTGENIWQLSPDMGYMGEALAEYTVNLMGLKRFATLAPMDDSRSYFIDSFTSKAEELGAEIACQEWYYSESLDLGKNFKSIRDVGFKLAYEDSTMMLFNADSLYYPLADSNFFNNEYLLKIDTTYFSPEDSSVLIDTSFYKIDTSYFGIDTTLKFADDSLVTMFADSILQDFFDSGWKRIKKLLVEKARFQRLEVDSNNIQLSCYDGLIFPLAREEVDLYVPQYAFYNFKTNLFSLRDAFTSENMTQYRKFLSGLKTVGWGAQTDLNSAGYRKMLNDFIDEGLYAPNLDESLGYDTMKIALNIIYGIDYNQKSFYKDGFSTKGVFHDFEFEPGIRVNKSVDFYKFDGFEFVQFSGEANSY